MEAEKEFQAIIERGRKLRENIEKQGKKEEMMAFMAEEAGSPVALSWGDSDSEEEEKREWKKPMAERLGEKRPIDDEKTVERRRKRQRRAREFANLRESEGKLREKVADLRGKLATTCLEKNEMHLKVGALERQLERCEVELRKRTKEVEELKKKASQDASKIQNLRSASARLEQKWEAARAKLRPSSATDELDKWILLVRERLGNKKGTLYQSAEEEEMWLKLLECLGPAPPRMGPV